MEHLMDKVRQIIEVHTAQGATLSQPLLIQPSLGISASAPNPPCCLHGCSMEFKEALFSQLDHKGID